MNRKATISLLSAFLAVGSIAVGLSDYEDYPDRLDDPRWLSDGFFVTVDGEPVEEGDVVYRGTESQGGCEMEGSPAMTAGGSPSASPSRISIYLNLTEDCESVIEEIIVRNTTAPSKAGLVGTYEQSHTTCPTWANEGVTEANHDVTNARNWSGEYPYGTRHTNDRVYYYYYPNECIDYDWSEQKCLTSSATDFNIADCVIESAGEDDWTFFYAFHEGYGAFEDTNGDSYHEIHTTAQGWQDGTYSCDFNYEGWSRDFIKNRECNWYSSHSDVTAYSCRYGCDPDSERVLTSS